MIVRGGTRDADSPDKQVGAVLGVNGRAEAVTAGACTLNSHSALSQSTGTMGRLGEAPEVADGSSATFEWLRVL